jgi:hypothetical protein
MAIYDYNSNTVAEQLTPPTLRGSKFLAWLYVLVKPIQDLHDLIFSDYKTGNVYSDYNNLTTYNFGERVRWTDKAIYECIATTSLGNLPSDATKWIKVNDVFIGTDERVKYSSQKLLYEQALNTFFITTGIYIQNNFVSVGNVFVMDSTSEGSSIMSYSNDYQPDFMDYTATYSTAIYDYTIYVPILFYASLGTNANTIISTYANKYKLAGMQFNVITY